MSYKNILVHIDGTPESERRIQAAGQLAALFGAHVTGVAILAPLELPQRLRSHPGATAILKDEFDKALAVTKAQVKSFPAQARAAGALSADAKLEQAEALEAITAAARSADLVVLSQPGADDTGAFGSHYVESAVLESGRPVLLVPRKGAVKTIGRKVLVAWKNAGASARALSDARPLLEKAQSVTVLVVDEDGRGNRADEALAYLERHGTKAQAVVAKSDDAGDAILSQGKKLGVDLIVMGAFARPRFAEMVLGGATRTVLQQMTTCVLMSH